MRARGQRPQQRALPLQVQPRVAGQLPEVREPREQQRRQQADEEHQLRREAPALEAARGGGGQQPKPAAVEREHPHLGVGRGGGRRAVAVDQRDGHAFRVEVREEPLDAQGRVGPPHQGGAALGERVGGELGREDGQQQQQAACGLRALHEGEGRRERRQRGVARALGHLAPPRLRGHIEPQRAGVVGHGLDVGHHPALAFVGRKLPHRE